MLTLLAGGALTGGLVFGVSLVSARTTDEAPAAEEPKTVAPADAALDSTEEATLSTAKDGKTPETGSTDDHGSTETEGRKMEGECEKDRSGDGTGTSFRGRSDVLVR